MSEISLGVEIKEVFSVDLDQIEPDPPSIGSDIERKVDEIFTQYLSSLKKELLRVVDDEIERRDQNIKEQTNQEIEIGVLEEVEHITDQIEEEVLEEVAQGTDQIEEEVLEEVAQGTDQVEEEVLEKVADSTGQVEEKTEEVVPVFPPFKGSIIIKRRNSRRWF